MQKDKGFFIERMRFYGYNNFMEKLKSVYGIGNPLIDIILSVSEEELKNLNIHKGTMQLISLDRQKELLSFIKDKNLSYSCGGSCPNTIICLASLKIPTTLAGKVGNDKEGQIYKENIHKNFIKDELVVCDETSGSSIILITPDKERTMNTYLGANRSFALEDLVTESITSADFLHFTGYMWDTNNQMSAIKRAISLAHKSNTKVSFDIADPFAVGRYRDTFINLIKNDCDIVFANNEEARILFDNYDAYECCKSMGKLCRTAVIKNGKRGSYISHERKIYSIDVTGPNKATDTTGAGDIYAAGFLYGLCHDYDIPTSGKIASYLAGEIITQVGAQFSSEKIKLIQNYINKNFNS